MNKLARTTLKVVWRTLAIYLIVCGVLLNMLVAYYFPVIDRLAIRPCYYYPKALADCQKN